jgi:ribose transport system substrate-binding protein
MDKHLVVVMPAAAHGWIGGVVFFAEQKGRELGMPNYRVLTSENVAEQAGQLQELITQQVDAIVLFPHSDELTFAAQDVLDAGIPLFVFNRNVDVAFNARLLGSNLLIGGESARVIAERIGGNGVVAYIEVPPVGSTSVERITAFRDVMADFPGIELVNMTATAISIEEGLRVTTDMLTANPHVDAIFTIDDSLSLGALAAVDEAGRSDVQVINGSGGSQVYFNTIIERDDVFLLTATFAASMIVDTIDLAVEYLQGNTDFSDRFDPNFPIPNVIIIPPTIIDRYNVEDFLAPGSPW